MDPDSIDCKTKLQLGSSEPKAAIVPEERSLVPKNSDSSKSDSEQKMSKPQNTSDDGLEDSSTKESSSVPSSPSRQRSPLHNAKPDEKSNKSNEKQQKDDSKKEKSKLRKGKWTVEEEQYTAHIIKCFNDGLLTLPEGSTLRGYLADRLNCNPMRITKKFTGACGLTRRVYHLHDRRNALPAEVERAKVELNHLEQRFRMRVEQEQSGLPLSHRDGIFHPSQVQSGISPSIPLQHYTPATYLPPWTQSFPDVSPLLGVPGGGRQLHPGPSSQYPFSSHLGHWMLPNPADALSTTSNTTLHSDPSAHFLTSLMTSYLTQVAAASIAAPSTLLSQQQQQQPQTKKRLQNSLQLQSVGREEKMESTHEEVSRQNPTEQLPSVSQPRKEKSPENDVHSHLSPVQQLQRGYEAHLESLRKSSSTDSGFVDTKSPKSDTSMTKNQALETRKDSKKTSKSQGRRSEDDEGTILLLDFMKSAQRACGDPPMNDKKGGDKTTSNAVQGKGDSHLEISSTTGANEPRIQSSENSERHKKYRLQPVAVTDTSTLSRSETSSRTSSQPTESSSSIEDSDSKSDKTDPSSGEESEKESPGDMRYTGPPRKRLKTNSSVKEFTAQNLAEHSRMMDKRNEVKDKNIEN